MTLFLPATVPARDRNGTVLGNAVWNFYHQQTLSPADVVGAVDSVTADSNGDFADITLETDVTYRAVLKDADGRVLFDIGAVLDNFFSPAVKRAIDENSRVLSGATWSFYTTGTTTRQPVYSDDTLATKLGYVVRANGAGAFPNIYLDDAVTYKAVLADSEGTTLATLDPVNTNTMTSYLDPTALLTVEPSADFNGTAGSGFGSPYGEVPTDPTRTTAKPAMRLLTPPFQWFTDEILIGVYAGANDSGSLMDTMGLEKVIVHYEGNTAEVLSPSYQTFDDANGNPVTYFGWWCRLTHGGTNGHGNVYFEAVPRDATMQRRVIGPYQYSPQAALHDYSVVVAPSAPVSAGVSYQTLTAAIEYLRVAGAQNPLITFTETVANHPLGSSSAALWYLTNGWLNITANAPVTLIASTGVTTFRPKTNGIRLIGNNITLDYVGAGEFYKEVANSRDHWMDGINITNSGGRNHLYNKLSRVGFTYLVRGNAWFTECSFTAMWSHCGLANLARGNTIDNGYSDIFTSAVCVIGNTVTDHDSTWHRTYVPALTVQYTGAGTTATLEMTGSNVGNNRVITAKVDGVSVGTFTVVNNNTAGNYDVADVVTWLNTLTDWTATLLDDTRAACALEPYGSVGAWSATSAKTLLTLYTYFDIHADFGQIYGGENVVVADNVAHSGLNAQDIFFKDGYCYDFLVVNNAFANEPPVGDFSQMADAHKHVVLAHNTFSSQGFYLRTDFAGATPAAKYNPDAYCLFANNTMLSMAWLGTADADLVITNNHLQSGTAPSGATGTVISGTEADLFADAQNGDFTPAGALLANLKAPVVKYDINRVERGATAPVGALA